MKSLHLRNLSFGKQCFLMFLILLINVGFKVPAVYATRFMENLDRGMVAVYKGGTQVYVGWRMLGTDPSDISFNLYRNGTQIASSITGSTNYTDTSGSLSSTYQVASVIGGVEQDISEPVGVWGQQYLTVPLQRPVGGSVPHPDNFDEFEDYTYSPNDASVGDLDGDGEYEIVLKWDPSNAHDNAHYGYTGNVYLDAYEMDGTFLWRIDLGINIRAGAHYTQFMVYDFDSDGTAEIACKTADGTVDGMGTVIGDAYADYRDDGTENLWCRGKILSGPEYFTIFDGQTGAALTTVDYNPPRHPDTLFPTPSQLDAIWGDNYGNRCDRFLAGVAYLGGENPSIVMCRGYYTRTVLVAWDFRDGMLTQRWVFDSDDGYPAYAGQGNHNLSVGDVDQDGKDEIAYGGCVIDDDGTGFYSTGLDHGDAMHMSDMDPARPGLELWRCLEWADGQYGAEFRDAGTGEVLIRPTAGKDTGRACAGDIRADYPGYEMWASTGVHLYSCTGVDLGSHSLPINFMVWWDGDLLREFLDSNVISKYGAPAPLTAYGCSSNNGSKSTPCLSADILGDWREEVIWRTSDNQSLRIYTTTDVTSHRIYTLMHDPQYRLAIAWQNVGYNQPPHPSFYIGAGMDTPPNPDIILIGGDPNETDPPIPDPMGWEVKPYANCNNTIAMQATAALDASGVEYYFKCTYGGGHDSGWQSSPYYEDSGRQSGPDGLPAGTEYTYTVTARDKSDNQNATMASVPATCALAVNVPAQAAWDFEDGTVGTAFSNMPDGGSRDTVNGYIMYGFDDYYGPLFSNVTPSNTGLSMYCQDNHQDGYTVDGTFNAWSPSTWTIEVSVYLKEISGWETIIGRDGSSQGEAESDFYLSNNGIDDKFRINIDTVGGQRWILDGDYTVQINQWYRIAVTSDGVTLKMYLDNGSGYTEIGSLDISAQSVANNALAATNYNWTFGRGWYNGGFVDHIDGYIDNVRFSNSALSPEQFLGPSSGSIPWLYGDFSGNHFVNNEDLAVFSKLWLREDCESLNDFDVDENCLMSVPELSELANNWMASL